MKNTLIRNIIEQINELQLKLGYAHESVTLFYPYASLRFLLKTEKRGTELIDMAKECIASSGLGKIEVSPTKGKALLTLSPEAVTFIYENYAPSNFLRDFIELFSNHHGITTGRICEVFEKYSSDYSFITMPKGSDFDYVFYFSNPEIDSFYYCIKDEFGHMIYHRFMESDYRALGVGRPE